MALRCVYTDLDGTMLGRGASLLRDAEGNFSTLAIRALEAVPPRRRRGRDQVRPPQGTGARGRPADRPARVHLRDGLRARGRRRGGLPDRVVRARRRGERPRPDRARRARRGCCSRPSRAASSPTRRGTRTAASRTCSAATSRWRRSRRCSPSTALDLRLVDNGITARRSPELKVDEVHVYHLIPAAAGQGARGRDPHAPPRACARRRRSRSATRAAISRSPTWPAGSSWSRTASSTTRRSATRSPTART